MDTSDTNKHKHHKNGEFTISPKKVEELLPELNET